MSDSDDRICTQLPESLRRFLPDLPPQVELLGRGNNAVVIRDPCSGDAIKLCGHDKLLDDPIVHARIERHYAAEILALDNLKGMNGLTPKLISQGRLHPSREGIEAWDIKQVFGWLRMSYIDGHRQDVIAQKYLGLGFKDNQLNDAFYHSVGNILGKLHKAGSTICASQIQHNIHENELTRVHLFVQMQTAKWEATNTSGQFSEKREKLEQQVREIENSHMQINQHRGSQTFLHGDFARRNLLYTSNHDQFIASAIVDFGAAGIGLPEYDFINMGLGNKPAAIEGYEAAGRKFSPERYNIVKRHDDLVLKLAMPKGV